MQRHDRTWHQRHRERLITSQRVADAVAKAMGSWPFIITQTVPVVLGSELLEHS